VTKLMADLKKTPEDMIKALNHMEEEALARETQIKGQQGMEAPLSEIKVRADPTQHPTFPFACIQTLNFYTRNDSVRPTGRSTAAGQSTPS